MANKIYLGKGRASDEYDLINFSICLSEIPKNKIVTARNGKKYLSLTIARMKEPDKYNKTHTLYIDEYKPQEQPVPEKEDDSDLPF
jgi:hypothetical protein